MAKLQEKMEYLVSHFRCLATSEEILNSFHTIFFRIKDTLKQTMHFSKRKVQRRKKKASPKYGKFVETNLPEASIWHWNERLPSALPLLAAHPQTQPPVRVRTLC